MKINSVFPIKSFSAIILLLSFLSCSKNDIQNTGNGGRGSDSPSATVITDINYGANTDPEGRPVQLLLDVYIPKNVSAGQKLPFVLFAHGGGFIGGDKKAASKAMESFASNGFVAASINYRLDPSLDSDPDPCTRDSVENAKAVYMAVQDTRAAMRFMVANADKYNIDTSKIFLNGNSAGAITVLNSWFLTQQNFNERIPGVESELGGIDNSGNNLNTSWRIIGMAANSGCLPDLKFITASNAIPTIFFHGRQDSVIPVKNGNTYYCPNSLYVYGSITMSERFSELGVPSVIHIDEQGGHGPYTQEFLTENEICFFNSVLSSKPVSGSYKNQQYSCP